MSAKITVSKLERTLRNGYPFFGKRKLLLKQFTATSSDEIDNNYNDDDDDNDQNNTLIYERYVTFTFSVLCVF